MRKKEQSNRSKAAAVYDTEQRAVECSRSVGYRAEQSEQLEQSMREKRAHLTDHHTFSRLLACSLFYSNPHRLVRVKNMLHYLRRGFDFFIQGL